MALNFDCGCVHCGFEFESKIYPICICLVYGFDNNNKMKINILRLNGKLIGYHSSADEFIHTMRHCMHACMFGVINLIRNASIFDIK